ncbi:hypothetical protein N9118_10985 [Akkermansiaceae bacterium]|nr:hypothetical protein [Akkermansiaceae bacterium]
MSESERLAQLSGNQECGTLLGGSADDLGLLHSSDGIIVRPAPTAHIGKFSVLI